MIFYGCRSTKVVEPVPEPAPEPELPEPPAPKPPAPKPRPLRPFTTDWAGTTWIFRDVPESSREFPGYRGVHFARDGKLLLINMETAQGKSWEARGNRVTFHLETGVPSLPLKGEFQAFFPKDAPKKAPAGSPRRVLFVPASQGSGPKAANGIILEEAKVNVDVVENHWIPRYLEEGSTVPWPMGREIHLMLLPNASGGLGILGYGGENRFRGDVHLGRDTFVPGTIMITRKTGPAIAFENLYVKKIAEATRYVQVDDDLYLFAETRQVVGFRMRLFD